MARNRSPIFKLQGTIHNLTFVDSKAYGAHVRTPRGTYQPVRCNATLTQNYRRTDLLNATGSPVYRGLKEAAGRFVQRNLWAKILSRMRTCGTDDAAALLGTLQGLEVNEAYCLDRFGAAAYTETKKSRKGLAVALHLKTVPVFGRNLKADAYSYTVTVIWICKGHCFITDQKETEWAAADAAPADYALVFTRPQGAMFYVLCLGLQAGLQERPLGIFTAMGMRVVETGRV